MKVTVNHPNNRSLDKILETAEKSGHLQLVNRRLKDIHDLLFKHDFSNLTLVDLSRNRLNETPPEIFDWYCLHTLNISHNLLKSLPECISDLMLLQIIDLSNNCLTVLPPQICDLQFLQIVKLSGNKLISLPEEISRLQNCQELDVSVNELTSIPQEISKMTSLLYLNIRRNNIHALPDEISTMQLTHLDAACNLITTVPVSFRNMSALRSLILDNNPLTSPRLPVLRKGQIHLFRELEIQAERAQIKKDVMDDPLLSPMKRSSSIRSDVNFIKMKAHSLSVNEADSGTDEERLEKAAELSRDRRKTSITSVTTSSSGSQSPAENVEEKKPSPKKREVIKPVPTKQLSSGNIPSRKPKTPPKNVPPKERKRSSSGNFERKNSNEALLIHQKLSGFPGYRPTPNERSKPQVGNASLSKIQEAKNRPVLTQSDRNTPSTKTSTPVNPKKGAMPAAIKPRVSLNRIRGNSFASGDKEGQFTMRRKTEKLYEELELMENLRQAIEGRMKTTLGDDLPSSLSDGVILCHMTNQVRPRSISMIHVPSPAVPKLNLAKRRKNIDSFLDACAKLGVPSMHICSAQDILLEKNISKVAMTVNELLKFCPPSTTSPKRQSETPTVKVTASTLSKHPSVV